ncbi:class I SAM-dependent methyltransferase [Phytohabitans sp. ZYX-F-186]|uniref:Class I SAM-dependent methyltransferase n=1 Tax=Phytohabitans maris TaxID=3071409 RepID=A0ABU0ZR53_9ACTN|nr:class I SAM-dependent methyltransferase [Phytohabitans sp. ZYX-F-186]MDQ7909506.1 class I SAM-dependent methyltransferase [Phytohabitans sp. ZYX-F-186]
MAGVSAVDRRRWVVEALAVGPDDRLLEIGCGGGTATALAAERLRGGHVLAIDRAASAVRRARERNAAHIRAGTVEVRQADITAVELPERSFDTVFAVNVSLFWLATPPRLLDRIGRLLVPGGTLRVFAERPTHAAVEAVAGQAAAALRTRAFTLVTATVTGTRAAVTATNA